MFSLHFAHYLAHSKQPINICVLQLDVEMYYLVGKNVTLQFNFFENAFGTRKLLLIILC